MNFDLTGADRALLGAIEEILADAGLQGLAEMQDAAPAQIAEAIRPWLHRLGDGGYLAAGVADGGEPGRCALLVAQQALARECSPLMVLCEGVVRSPAMLIARHGSAALKEAVLGDLRSGRRICAIAAAEPGSGSSPARYTTMARRDGGGYVLDGVKSPVSLGSVADSVLVLAQLDDVVAGFVVDGKAEGLGAGARMMTLGHGLLAPVELRLDGVRVDGCNVLLPPQGDAGALLEQLRRADDRMAVAASLGLMKRAYDEAVKVSGARRDGGKPPSGHQLVRFETAEMLMLCQTAELLAMRATSDESGVVGLCSKVFVTESACRVTEIAMQISAAAGYIKPNALERCFREARLGTIVGHTSEVARMAIADDSLARVAG